MAKNLSNLLKVTNTAATPVSLGGTGVMTLTGIVKANGTNPFVAATAGTDYLAPGGNLANCTNLSLTSGVTGTLPVANGGTGTSTLTGLVKANGINAFVAATAGTDYLAPPTGTSILKANSSGALVNAVAGVDYVFANTATTFTKPQTPSTSAETAPSTNAVTWDLTTNQIFRINLNANITTFNLTGTLSSLVGNQYEVIIRYNGGSTVSWNTNMKWTAATAPTLTGTSGKIDVLTFVVASTDGTNYYLVNTGIKLNVG